MCTELITSRNVLTRFSFGSQNSPNDLQMLSDAPAHHLFCLLPPVPPTQNALPEVLAVVQVKCAFEVISKMGTKRTLPGEHTQVLIAFLRFVWRERYLGSPS